jgi:hypothetical protein
VQIGLNSYGGCGLTEDGEILCWGKDFVQAPDCEANLAVGMVCPPSGNFESLMVGGTSVCGVEADGRTRCRRPAGTVDAHYSSVSGGWLHLCGVDASGALDCSIDHTSNPGVEEIWLDNAPEGAFTKVSAGSGHDCAIRTDGTLVCWKPWDDAGSALVVPDGQFGDVVNQVETTTQGGRACALGVDNTVACFSHTGPVQTPDGFFTQIAVGDGHYCGLREDGSVECWGRGKEHSPCFDGGLGAPSDYECGQAAPPDGTFLWIAASDFYSCGLGSDGNVTCWGHLPWDPCGLVCE